MGGDLHCPHPATGTNVLLWEERWSQLRSRESWTEAFCALRCLNHLSWTFLAVLRCPGSSGVHCSAPRRRKALCQSISCCVLAAEHHCLVLSVCWSLLPPASSHMCCQLQKADPKPLSSPLAQRDTATPTLRPEGWSDPQHASGW